MAFQYGSDSPQINNPFKLEGLLYLICGSIITILSLFPIISIRSKILEKGLAFGWMTVFIGLIVLSVGIHFLAKGIIKMSRFYVGRGVPTSLAKNLAKSEKHTNEPNVYYNSKELEQMIMGRKNITFREPVTLLERVVYGIFPNFLFLPVAMRNYLHILIRNVGATLIVFIFYLLAILSGSIGLTLLTESSFTEYLGIAVCIYLLILWLKTPLSVKKVTNKKIFFGTNKHIAVLIVLSIIAPAIGEVLLRYGITFPEAPFNPVWAIVLTVLLIVIVTLSTLFMAKLRSDISDPKTEVSESRDHWVENVHPKDFFRALDMDLADFRYKEIPNRIYRELNPTLHMEGSMDKGSFRGDTIQETQPIVQEKYYPPLLEKTRLITAIVGHIFVFLACLLLVLLDARLTGSFQLSYLFNIIFYPSILGIAGVSLLTLAHLYWGEILFKSYMIQFQGEGTYTESKLSVGMAITDSVRSENTVVRTSYSSWLLVTELLTSTQARSGTNSFTNARYIMSMYKADGLMSQLLERIREFLDNRELIAVTGSEKDGEAIKSLYAINSAKPNEKKLEELTGSEKKAIPQLQQEEE